jgi:hypothetical protein
MEIQYIFSHHYKLINTCKNWSVTTLQFHYIIFNRVVPFADQFYHYVLLSQSASNTFR